MKKIKLLILFSILSCAFTQEPNEVYICNSKTSKRYHYRSDCRGLNRCKSKISKVTLQEAKNKGRTLCGYED